MCVCELPCLRARVCACIGVRTYVCMYVCIVVLTWFTTCGWIRLVARVSRGGFLSVFVVVFLVIINNYFACISVSQ